MKKHTLLLSLSLLLTALAACSPAEPPSETFLDSQKQVLDKAKQVEKIGLDHKLEIDNTINKAEHN